MNNIRRPDFSVIIPTHNRAHLLPRAIKSVLNQTHKDFELLIVDDASTDKTQEVVAEIQNERIIYIRREKNSGVGATRNAGILQAAGKYVSLLDDDDEYLPDFLEETYLTLEGAPENVGFGWCGIRWLQDTFQGEKLIKEELWQPQFDNREQAYLSFLQSRRIGTNCGLTFRRSVFESVGLFDEDFRGGAEDTDFLIRLVRQFDFKVVSRVLIKVHLHSGANLRSYSSKKAEDYQRIIQRHRDALLNHPNLWVTLHYKTGWLYYHDGNRAVGRRYMLQALRKNPLHLKSWMGLLLYETLGSKASKLHKQISTWKASLYPDSARLENKR